MTIVIGINSLSSSQYAAYTNHIQLFYRLGIWAGKNGHKICLVNPSRMSIDRMRNLCAKTALEVNADYLLFIDDDVIVPTDFIEKLIEADADIVAGDVIIRGWPFDHMCFLGDKKALYPIQNMNDEILGQGKFVIDVGAVGFSLCLIKTDLIRKIPQPWFITGVNNTEDIYFCLKVREFFPETTIRVDTSIQCGHILWNEIISKDNKEAYMEYCMKNDKDLQWPIIRQKESDTQPSGDRGELYLNEVKGLFAKEGETL